ncbi:sensory rhodopsin transducer [Algoriphagus sp. NG3]|uniref:sensory rhodopsin transducer n=1 Tax=Algoriphagus sp. NG3 TaxID=3097546 RepID=UPI002A7ED064|nr:sensory rhodopsin transducer [Algoriphagus sp. NG3]WPR74513.1 sensory rhodopsin transducer [Algoriphagus sp. NG3]
MEKNWGKKIWGFPGGFIPAGSTGKEPEMLSKDEISILNTAKTDAEILITIYYADRNPVSGYSITVKAERVKQFRVNDLIDPHAIPLGLPYAAILESSVPVIVQWSKQVTADGKLGLMGSMAYPIDVEQ